MMIGSMLKVILQQLDHLHSAEDGRLLSGGAVHDYLCYRELVARRTALIEAKEVIKEIFKKIDNGEEV